MTATADPLSPHPALPVSLYLRNRRVVVVGSGPGSGDRIERIRAAGAIPVIRSAAEVGDEDLRSAFAVFAHDDDDTRNRDIARRARLAGATLVYAHDQPTESDFAMPAQVSRGPLKIAISTDGAAPALSRRLREELGRVLAAAGAKLDALITILVDERARLPRSRRAELYERIARRLCLTGTIEVGAEPEP